MNNNLVPFLTRKWCNHNHNQHLKQNIGSLIRFMVILCFFHLFLLKRKNKRFHGLSSILCSVWIIMPIIPKSNEVIYFFFYLWMLMASKSICFIRKIPLVVGAWNTKIIIQEIYHANQNVCCFSISLISNNCVMFVA